MILCFVHFNQIWICSFLITSYSQDNQQYLYEKLLSNIEKPCYSFVTWILKKFTVLSLQNHGIIVTLWLEKLGEKLNSEIVFVDSSNGSCEKLDEV